MNTRILYALTVAGFFATAYFLLVAKSFELAIIASILAFASTFIIFVERTRMRENTEIHCGRL